LQQTDSALLTTQTIEPLLDKDDWNIIDAFCFVLIGVSCDLQLD